MPIYHGFGATLVIASCVFLPAAAFATGTGAAAGVTTISPCPSFCGGPGGMFDSDLDGGEGFVSASAALANSDGNGQAQSSLNGPTALPVLSMDAFSGPDSRVGSDATGVREYVYNGAMTNITLDLTLDGDAGAPDPSDASLQGNVAVIKGTDLPFTTHFPTLIFEIVPGDPDLELVESLTLDFFGFINLGPQTLTGSLNVPLEDGDNFFVWAGLIGSGTRSGFADASTTLTMSFSDDTGITVIPEPSTLLMMLGGLGLLARISGRRPSFPSA
jgi:hypothetical protein